MADYLEVKKVFCKVLGMRDADAIDGDSDMKISLSRYDENRNIVIYNA